jgi:hypothetical protein
MAAHDISLWGTRHCREWHGTMGLRHMRICARTLPLLAARDAAWCSVELHGAAWCCVNALCQIAQYITHYNAARLIVPHYLSWSTTCRAASPIGPFRPKEDSKPVCVCPPAPELARAPPVHGTACLCLRLGLSPFRRRRPGPPSSLTCPRGSARGTQHNCNTSACLLADTVGVRSGDGWARETAAATLYRMAAALTIPARLCRPQYPWLGRYPVFVGYS